MGKRKKRLMMAKYAKKYAKVRAAIARRNGKTTEENIITENVVTENIITENIITENINLTENVVTETLPNALKAMPVEAEEVALKPTPPVVVEEPSTGVFDASEETLEVINEPPVKATTTTRNTKKKAATSTRKKTTRKRRTKKTANA